MRKPDEIKLLRAAQAGDRAAADALLAPHRAMLQRFFATRAPASECDDLVQDVLLRAVRALPNFRGDCPVSNWLLYLAVNRRNNFYTRDHFKNQHFISLNIFVEETGLLLQHNSDGPGLEKTVEQQIYAQHLLEALRTACSPIEKTVLLLIIEGHNSGEIADLLKTSPATVRSHLKRGREKLLAYLVREAPELIGGQQAVLEARKRAQQAEEIEERLTAQEAEALMQAAGNAAPFRTACRKIARYFVLPFQAFTAFVR